MNIKILIAAIGVIAMGSCSPAYKAGQTPDDVYYSPDRPMPEYVSVAEDNRYYSPQNDNRYQYDDYDMYRNDRWMRMSIGNPYRMYMFNDYYWNDWNYPGFYHPGLGFNAWNYGFNNWNFGFNSYWYSPWGAPFYWNSFYNPYAYNYIIINNPKGGTYTPPARPSVFNRNTYSNTRMNSANTRSYYNPRTGTYSNYNNTNTNRVRTTPGRYYDVNSRNTSPNSRTYTPSNTDRPSRTYTPSSGNSGSRSSGNSGGSIKRPQRGN